MSGPYKPGPGVLAAFRRPYGERGISRDSADSQRDLVLEWQPLTTARDIDDTDSAYTRNELLVRIVTTAPEARETTTDRTRPGRSATASQATAHHRRARLGDGKKEVT